MNNKYKNNITFIGTGTSVGVPMIGCNCFVCISENKKDKRFRTSAFIKYNDKNLLIDIGPDFRTQALINKIIDIDAILITHSHVDHVGGLDDLRGLSFSNNKKIKIFLNEQTLESLKKLFFYMFEPTTYSLLPNFSIQTIYNEAFEVDDIKVIPIKTIHGDSITTNYRIGNLAYLTDFNYIEESEIQKLKGIDILVLDSLRIEKHSSHLSLNESLELSKKINPKRTYLTHLSHNMGLHNEVEKLLPSNVFIAYDGLRIDF